MSRGRPIEAAPDCRVAAIGNSAGQLSLTRPNAIDTSTARRTSVRVFLDLEFDTFLFGDGVHILEGAHDRPRERVAGLLSEGS